MALLPEAMESRLLKLGSALIDQQAARVLIPAQQQATGFWFGGGNVCQGPDKTLYVVGRYRNAGDSRTGLQAGQRGLELAIWRLDPTTLTAEKLLSFAKSQLDVENAKVLSIEGAALRWRADGPELFVSTEKSGLGYPAPFSSYLKPGTGVWTIDRLQASSLDALAQSTPTTLFSSRDPEHLHLKDPALYRDADGGSTLIFCTHPFSWSSSNTGLARQAAGSEDWTPAEFACFARGPCWDVAMTRTTAMIDVPPIGPFRDHRVTLVFYDGGESLRNLDEHSAAVRRPRGYSCEELGGLAYLIDGDWSRVQRLSRYQPLFVSPWGTGSSRYVDVLSTDQGWLASWQQSQDDGSQPLVIHALAEERIREILA